MNAFLKIFDLVPSWVYALVIAGLVAVVGLQGVHVSSLKVDISQKDAEIAQQKADLATERQARADAALEHERHIAKLQADHAAQQQEKEDAWNKEKLAQAERRRNDAATVTSLRNQIAAFSSGDRRPGETDAAALQRTGDRLKTLGGLLQEGVDLLAEGRGILERRDSEVARLVGQIEIDRTACGWRTDGTDKKP